MEGRHAQAGAQGGQQGILLTLTPAAKQHGGGGAQHGQEDHQAGNAHFGQHLDIVVVDVLALVEERLHAGDQALNGGEPVADDGTLLIDAQAVLKKGDTLDGVFVGPDALNPVGGKARQELVAQLDGSTVGKADRLQLGAFRGGEGEVDHLGALWDGEGGLLQSAAVENRAGVGDGLRLILALHGDGGGALPFTGERIGTRARIDGAQETLTSVQSIAAGHVPGQDEIDHQQHGKTGHYAESGLSVGLQNRIQAAAREAVECPQQQAGYRGGQRGNQAGSAGRSQERKCHKGHD